MATLLFTAVGTLLGGPLGGAIGALAGRQVDSLVFRPAGREGPRLNELSASTSSYGLAIPRQFGTMRVAGQIIWATDLVEHREKQGGGKGRPSTTSYSYTASFAVALSSRPVGAIGRVWADGKLLRGAAGDLKVGGTMRLHSGLGDQTADSLIAAAEGAARCPAWRGLAYVVFEDLQLADFGNRIPALTFEVLADSAPLTVASLLDGVIEDCSADIPLPGLTGLGAEGSLADLLATLDPVFPIECNACGDSLELIPALSQAEPLHLPDAATSASREDFGGNAGYARNRKGQIEQPLAVLRYYDVDRDFQPGAQRAPGRPLPGQPRTVELPAALHAATARELVSATARRESWARQTIAWRVTQIDPALRPGAIVTVPGHPGRWKVREWEWREHGVDLMLARAAPTLGLSGGADAGRIEPLPDVPLAESQLIACELPWDGDPATPVPLILAAASSASPAWAGASLYVDQGDGALDPLGTTGRARAILGHAATALPPRSPLLFDRQSWVEVELAGTDLVLGPASQRQLAMGANRAMLGAELLQFAAAEPLGGSRWRLSGLWRGRGGTESALSGHAPGEPFLLLDGAGVQVTTTVVPGARLAVVGLGDSAPVTSPVRLAGIGMRPLSPVHGRIVPGLDGSIDLRWARRARGAWNWQDGGEVPLGEQSEAWLVTFGPPDTPLAQWPCDTSQLHLEAAELAPLIAAAPHGPLAVRQLGDRDRSELLILTLS